MPINDRLDRENVAHIHHGILCSYIKQWVCVISRAMDEPGNHYSQQTDTRIKYQTLHVLQQWEHMDTGRGASNTGVCHGGTRGGTVWGGELTRDKMGRNARYRWWGGRQETTLPCMYLCNNLTCYSHVPQNIKRNEIYIYTHTHIMLTHSSK